MNIARRFSLFAVSLGLTLPAGAQMTAPAPPPPSAQAPATAQQAPQQQQPDPLTRDFRECIQKAQAAMQAKKADDPAAIFACLTAETKRQEARLGVNVGKLSSGIPPDDKKRLEQAGIDWRRFRDSNCRFIGDPKGAPPINLAYADCILNLTVGRSLEIERMVTMFAQQDEAMRAAAARNAAPAPAADAKK